MKIKHIFKMYSSILNTHKDSKNSPKQFQLKFVSKFSSCSSSHMFVTLSLTNSPIINWTGGWVDLRAGGERKIHVPAENQAPVVLTCSQPVITVVELSQLYITAENVSNFNQGYV
jgi:hypothetical protein